MRYFIYFWHWHDTVLGHEQRGEGGCQSAKFPNRKWLVEYICNCHGFRDVAITNIIEVSKDDYLEFFREDKC